MQTTTTIVPVQGPPTPDPYVFSGKALHPFVQLTASAPIGRCSHCWGTREQHTSVAPVKRPAQRVTAKPTHWDTPTRKPVDKAAIRSNIVGRIDLSKFV